MPAPGDQHTSWTNPFEEPKRKISEWTAKDIATISAKLDKQLGPEYISSRAGPGGSRVHYLTAEKCIGLANQVFGFNGWSSSIQNIQVDFADENPQTQRVSIGLSVIIRVTLRDGTYHEDIGYGSIENAKGKAMAFEKAKKEGTTDGLKRTLRSFGNVLGNCIYDQDYVKQVIKVKAHPVKKFDQDNLHRHSDFVKKEDAKPDVVSVAAAPAPKPALTESFEDFLGELDEADFCVPDEGHPDEVLLPVSGLDQHSNKQPGPAVGTAKQGRPPQTPNQVQSNARAQNGVQPGQAASAQQHPHGRDVQPPPPHPHTGNSTEPVAFFSAKAVKVDTDAQGQGNSYVAGASRQHLFDPKAESPSIRKTPGIDHSSSKPVSRSGKHVPPASSQSAGAGPANASSFTSLRQQHGSGPQPSRVSMTNMSTDQTRRIGAPGSSGSPLLNRGSYKPPTMKRPLAGEVAANGSARAPLVDISANANVQANGADQPDSLDSKRRRTA